MATSWPLTASGTHEIQLGFTIGKKKVIVKRQPRLTQTGDEAIPEAKVRGRKRRKKQEKEDIPDRKKVPAQPESKENFDDDSFREVEQGIILIPSEDESDGSSGSPANDTPGTAPDQSSDGGSSDATNGSVTEGATDPTAPDSGPDTTDEDLGNTWEGEGDIDPWQGIEDESAAVPPPLV